MKLKYIFDLSFENIRHRNLRSWLTILGIVIGVASIISLISISLGVSATINSRINTLPTNIVEINAGASQALRSAIGGGARFNAGGGAGGEGTGKAQPEITFAQADILKGLAGVYKLDPRIQKHETVAYQNQNATITVIGTDPGAFAESVDTSMIAGRYLVTSDEFSVVLGYGVANLTFNDINNIMNKQILIKDPVAGNIPFRVVGILNQSNGGFGGSDNSIFIPLQSAKRLFNESTNANQLIVVVAQDHNTKDVVDELDSELQSLHRVTNTTKDFTIITAASIAATVSGITDTLALFLGGIASISLVVGGIGVANTMFMSVLEQTRDIGVWKSIGATNRDVIVLFLCEAGIIGFVGGFLGVILSSIVSVILASNGVPTQLTPELLIGGMLFSGIIGIIAGVAPARNAAKIPPIEALRYE